MTKAEVHRINWIAISSLIVALLTSLGTTVWYAAQLSRQVEINTHAIQQLSDVKDRLSRVEGTLNTIRDLLLNRKVASR